MKSDQDKCLLSIIIISYNTSCLTKQCIETAIKECSNISFQIIVVDNASQDDSVGMIETFFPDITLVKSPINLGFGSANNKAFQLAKGQYIVLLNSDAILGEQSLKNALKHMEEDKSIGMGGAQLTSEDGSWQPSARMFPSLLNDFLILSGLAAKFPTSKFFGRPDRTWAPCSVSAQVDWVPGAFAIIPKQVLEEVGGFDERFFLYFEEVDLCKKITAKGYSIWYFADVKVVHLNGRSGKISSHENLSYIGSQITLWQLRSKYLYLNKHHGILSAFISKSFETLWYKVRFFKNKWSKKAESRLKEKESALYCKLINEAWRDTNGGEISPERPWR